VLQERGVEALRAKPHLGRPPRLTADQKQRLAEILRRGARAAGFPTDLWTLRRVAQVIQREFEVQYHLIRDGRADFWEQALARWRE
jgi:hypothetical protein